MGAIYSPSGGMKPFFRNQDELMDWIVQRLEQPDTRSETVDMAAAVEPEPRNDWERLEWIMRRLDKLQGTPASSLWSGRQDGFDALGQPTQIDAQVRSSLPRNQLAMRPGGSYVPPKGTEWRGDAGANVEGATPYDGEPAVAARERQRAYDVPQVPAWGRPPEAWEADAIRRAYQRDFGRMPTDEELNRDLGLNADPTTAFSRRTQHYRPLPQPGLFENYMAPIFRMFMPTPRPGPNPPMFPGKRG